MSKITSGIKDELFIRGKVPMTKEEVRTVTISKLDLVKSDIVLDIGAGTGSISIECGLLLSEGSVIAVETKEEAVLLIKENIEKFNLKNIKVINTLAPIGLEDLEFTKVVIGGSRGQMDGLFELIQNKKVLKVVINTITIENTYKAIELMKKYGYKNIEVTSMSIAKSKDIGSMTMMLGQNPVNIISGEVNNEK